MMVGIDRLRLGYRYQKRTELSDLNDDNNGLRPIISDAYHLKIKNLFSFTYL
jgi:hypothetical protein